MAWWDKAGTYAEGALKSAVAPAGWEGTAAGLGTLVNPLGAAGYALAKDPAKAEQLAVAARGAEPAPPAEAAIMPSVREQFSAPTQQPTAAPAATPPPGAGYGRMPTAESKYLEGGAKGEIARIEAEYDETVQQLKEYNAANPGASDPDGDAAHLAKAQAAKTQKLAKVAAFQATPQGRVSAIQRAQLEGVEARYESAMDIGRIEQDSARRVEHEAAQLASQTEANFEEQQRRQRDYEAAFSRMQGEFQDANDRISAERIDPDRWWKSRSTGQKILATISMAAGGWLQGAHGGPNYNAQQIQKHIDNDLAAQRGDLANRRAGLAAQGTILGRMRQHYGDMETAMLGAKRHIYTQHSIRARQEAARTRHERGAVQLTALADGWERQAFIAEQGIALHAERNARLEAHQMAAGRAHVLQQAQMAAQMDAMGLGGYQPMPGKDPMQSYIKGYGIAQGAPGKRVDELRELAAQHDVDSQEITRLIDIAESPDKGMMLLSDAASEFEQRFQTIRSPMKKEIAGAAENAAEKAAIDAMIVGKGGVTGRALGLVAKALRRKRDYDSRKMASRMRLHNVMPADVKFGPNMKDPTKGPRPYVRYGEQGQGRGIQLQLGPVPE